MNLIKPFHFSNLPVNFPEKNTRIRKVIYMKQINFSILNEICDFNCGKLLICFMANFLPWTVSISVHHCGKSQHQSAKAYWYVDNFGHNSCLLCKTLWILPRKPEDWKVFSIDLLPQDSHDVWYYNYTHWATLKY